MERKLILDDLLAERRISNDFRWASRSWPGSQYFVRGKPKEPKELVQSVLASQKVKDVIQELAKKNGESESKIRKDAQGILVEMAHDFHMYAIRWFGLILSKLGKKLYNSIQVNAEKIPKIRAAYQSYPVIILPTHRSYVDFLLISYLSFHYDLPLPIIAAGMDFMSMAGVGELLRKSGAFFIRRRFGGDILYWALISEYVKTAIMEGGHPFEMFIEGTRSRSGKSIKPKIGLLSSALELVASCEVPDILILPISMSYDRTLEETLYAHELLGKPKPKESTNGLMKALRWLGNQNYGSLYVNFGNIISVRRELEKLCSLPTSLSPQNTILNQAIQEIALKVILENQNQSVVPIFSAIATIALAKLSRGVNIVRFDELMEHLHSIQNILASSNHIFGYPLQRESFENNVRFIISVHSKLVTLQSGNNLVLVFSAQPENSVQHMTLQHYSNQILPFVVPLALVLILTKDKTNASTVPNVADKLMDKKLETNYCFLRQLLQDDFMYEPGSEVLELCFSLKYLDALNENQEKSKPQYRDTLNIFDVVRRALEPYIIAYWGVTMALQNVSAQNAIGIKELSILTQEVIHDLINSNKCVRQYGAMALETLTNGINSIVQFGVLSRVKLENSTYGVIVQDINRLMEIRDLLGTLVSGFKWNVAAGADTNGNPGFNEEKAGQGHQQYFNMKSKL